MNIPNTFELFGTTYNVVFDEHRCNKESAYGICDYEENTIYLTESYNTKVLPVESVENTFWHEVVHLIFKRVGLDDINDEKNVSVAGSALYQIVKTFKY